MKFFIYLLCVFIENVNAANIFNCIGDLKNSVSEKVSHWWNWSSSAVTNLLGATTESDSDD